MSLPAVSKKSVPVFASNEIIDYSRSSAIKKLFSQMRRYKKPAFIVAFAFVLVFSHHYREVVDGVVVKDFTFRQYFMDFFNQLYLTVAVPLLKVLGSTGIASAGKALDLEVLLVLLGLGTLAGIQTVFKPIGGFSRIGANKEGLWLLSGKPDNLKLSQFVAWESITGVSIVEKSNKRSSLEDALCIETNQKTLGLPLRLKFRLEDITSSEGRDYLLQSVEKHLPASKVDPKVRRSLKQLKDEASYTELWLKELSAPKEREKMQPLEVGSTLQNETLKVLSRVGSGGQATVYLAESNGSYGQKTVALKEFVLPLFSDYAARKAASEKFRKESQMLAQLDHPGIARQLDAFVEDHRAYLVLEKVEGNTLEALIEEKGIPEEAFVLKLALQMCEVLRYLHSFTPPVVHRDFTPDNLMLQKDGNLKLIDFSVAQQNEQHLTGTVVGKHRYVSPEQFKGKPTVQSDIYSLGATLFFLLTGQEPEALSVSCPRSINTNAGQDIDQLVARATALSVEERFQNIEEVIAALKQCVNVRKVSRSESV